MTRHLLLLVAGFLAAAGCESARERPVPPSGASVVDSALPREETLRRFRVGLDSVSELAGGAATRDQLIRGFVAALETRDTAALRSLVLTKQEFAWIYYPTTPQSLPPYDLAPALLWFTTETRGRTGLNRALAARGGMPLRFVRATCDSVPSREGENVVWGPCVVTRRQERGDLIEERLFGSILERRGRFKFVSYANKLD